MEGIEQTAVLTTLAKGAHATAMAHGFHEVKPVFGAPGADTRHILSWLALIHTEVSEAAEEARKGDKEKFAVELADVIIRVLDVSHALGIDIGHAVAAKMAFNVTRPIKHGGKLA